MTQQPLPLASTSAEAVVEHLRFCANAQAVIVATENADEIVARMMAAGWKLRERTGLVAGKRIRYLEAPGGGG